MYIYFSLHVSGDYVLIIKRYNCIYATLGICHSAWMTVWCAESHPHRVTNTKCRIDRVISPDVGHIVTRNMQRKEINIRGPSQKKCAERSTYRIEHQMCGKVLQSFSVVPLLPNDCIPTFWKVHDTRQVSRTVELSDTSGNGSRKVLQRRETHTTHVDFQF